MRPTLLIAVSALILGACAHEEEQEVRFVRVEREPVVQVETRAIEPPPESAAVARPRLSQTITIGENADPYTPGAPAPAQGSNVIVNNTVIVQGAPGYGYGYGYGYGAGYGSRGGNRYGRGVTGSADGRRGSPTSSQQSHAWAPSGWEGAQRTAAPGQTPNVGGGWSPPPSYGPAPMR